MNGNTPKKRAQALNRLLRKTYDEGRGSEKTNVIDMLADLRHLCDYQGLDFAECDRSAYRHYSTEVVDTRV